MAITQYKRRGNWDPFADFYSLADVFADRPAFMPSIFGRDRAAELPGAWHPSVDVMESDEKVFVSMDLPGLTKDEIDISFDGHVLSITGHRNGEKNGGWQLLLVT